ncbi:MAG TPA: TIM-barrel domain-containing protein, partial [Dehalococcoidia bacterium]|nr:TIM-barrel domain-containing protein [Dehalococcoidia bacterium]
QGDPAWYHVAAVSAVRPITTGQRVLATTTEPGAGPAEVDLRAVQEGIIRVAFQPPPGPPVVRTAFAAVSDEGEAFLGLGERFEGVSLAGRRVDLWTVDRREVGYGASTYLPVPWLLSSRGYGFLLDESRRSEWEMRSRRGDAWAVTASAPGLAFYLIGGHPALAIDRYTALTGRPPLPPRWGLGVVKTLIGGEARVLGDAARLRQDGIPVDGIYVYDAVDDAANLGWPHVTYDPIPTGVYPDVKALTDALRRLGYRSLGYFGPDFRPDRASFAAAAEAGHLVQLADGRPWVHPHFGIGLIDVFDPEAVHWWQHGPLKRALADLGFDGGMLDLGEALPIEASFPDQRTGAELHNAYPVAYAAAAQGALREYKPDGLFWARSGFTGGQRFHTGTWPGDPIHDWDGVTGLRSMIPAALSAGLAGYAYWHTEVGGYVDGGLDASADRELYLRWLQLGAFTAMLRDQFGDRRGRPTDIWTDAETLRLWRRYARIHQALVPYLWRTAEQAQVSGLPLIRHLAIGYPGDRRAWHEEGQYLLGEDLLVAPVLDPDVRERTVYLPTGAWRHWWTGATFQGPADVVVPAPLDQIPVFVRGGADSPLPDPVSFADP